MFVPHFDLRRNAGRFSTRIRGFAGDRRGISAVEFALVAPFLLILYIAGTDTSLALTINRKVHNCAATINDLVGQSQAYTKAELDGLFAISASVMAPYDQSKVFLRITQVKVDKAGSATVDWTRSRNTMIGTTALAAGDTYTLPAGFAGEKDFNFLVTEAYYSFEPFGGYGLTGPMMMGETNYLSPRLGDKVTCSDC
ncbi:TadE/TadG family type IV pilus assembly protein [Jiella marina]|uniref:TadE/TadG family type IV pilus assembly protein n=1 Tax=Jiella sp. LLJ827 TaxID=2917712 RepID=UPI0021009BB5|nr:TadE/TadG family type IV pilus assembly protein [Jiella sp. LLJ827]MCQ0987176.1 pilus assembly protein [Jiella sp. LLJ827]